MMKIKIKRIDKTLPLPEFKTSGSVGFDLHARTDAVVAPGELALIPLNIIIEIPDGYFLAVLPRSSTFKNTEGLMMAQHLGVVDRDYAGPEDELFFQAYNVTKTSAKVERGQRIAQGLILPIQTDVEWTEEEVILEKSRGGFGSTGKI